MNAVFDALKHCIDGAVVTSTAGRILFLNITSERIFGKPAASLVDGDISSILPGVEQIRSAFIVSPDGKTERRLPSKGMETHGTTSAGQKIPLEVTLSLAPVGDEVLHLYLLRDISTRREIEEQMDVMQAEMIHMARVSAIDEMGAALAHEINQPLTAVMLYLSTLNRGNAAMELSPNTRDIIEKAQREAERASQIIQRMRQFVVKRTPHRSEVSLDLIVDDAVELTMLGTRSVVRVEKSVETNLPLLHVDTIQIEQILVNLIRNAIEATRHLPEPKVVVSARSQSGFIRITVADNGAGIKTEALPDLFKAFASSKPDGLGLGLTISRNIAQNHGGDLTVDPGGHGTGAAFTLSLPIMTTPIAQKDKWIEA